MSKLENSSGCLAAAAPSPPLQVVTLGYYGSCRSLPCCRQSVWCRRAAVLQSLHSTHGSIGGGAATAPTISGPVSGYSTSTDNGDNHYISCS